jgi:exosortase
MLVAFTILFGSTLIGLVKEWSENANYSHGYFIPFITAYMILQKKNKIAEISIRTSNYGLLLIIIGMIVFVGGNLGAELFTMRTAIVITIFGICAYQFGLRLTSIIAVPLAYLMFMVPIPAIIWNKIAFPLQLLVAKLSSNFLQLMEIPILREGNILHLVNTSLEVVEACSGLRSLISLLAIVTAFAYTVSLTNISKCLLILSAIPIAVIVNILRLTSTALLAVYVDPETAHGFLHELSGVLVFILSLTIIYGIYTLCYLVESKYTKKYPIK